MKNFVLIMIFMASNPVGAATLLLEYRQAKSRAESRIRIYSDGTILHEEIYRQWIGKPLVKTVEHPALSAETLKQLQSAIIAISNSKQYSVYDSWERRIGDDWTISRDQTSMDFSYLFAYPKFWKKVTVRKQTRIGYAWDRLDFAGDEKNRIWLAELIDQLNPEFLPTEALKNFKERTFFDHVTDRQRSISADRLLDGCRQVLTELLLFGPSSYTQPSSHWNYQ